MGTAVGTQAAQFDLEAALEHGRRVARELARLRFLGDSELQELLSDYEHYLRRGVRASFLQLLASRRLIDQNQRGALETRFPFPAATGPTATERRRAWLECEPLPAVPVGEKERLTIGRQAGMDLVLPHKGVSRCHAQVWCRGEPGLELELEDCSTYGTFVNGQRVERCHLAPGDTISIGPYLLRVREDPTKGPADTVPFLLPGSKVEALRGSLEHVSLSEVLQQIEFNERTGTLHMAAAGARGSVSFIGGRVVTASHGAARDEDAVLRLMSWRRGEFSFTPGQPTERTMDRSVTAILMEASRIMDEG